jgi:hypothetical protein
VWSSRAVPLTFKLEESNDGTGGVEKIRGHSGSGMWEELCYDFPGETLTVIAYSLIFDNNVQGLADVDPDNWTFFYDDITQVESCPAGAPTMLPVDFENEPFEYEFRDGGGFEGGQSDVIPNPDPSGINTSAQVARMQKFPPGSGFTFGGSTLNLDVTVDVVSGSSFTMKVWSQRQVPVLLEPQPQGSGSGAEVLHTGTGWEELTFMLPLATTGTVDGITVIFDVNRIGDAINNPTDWTFYYDDITLVPPGGGSGGTEPSDAPTVPTADPGAVTSVFSNAYTDPADVNYNPGWGQATVATIESIAGNDVWKLAGLNYQGIDFVEFGGPALDVSGYDTLHLDYWSADATTLNVFLISPGAETPYNVPITTGSWQSVDIPLSAFSGVVDLTNVVQMKFDDNGTGEAATFFIDNIYFYTAGGGGTGGTALVDFETAGTGAGFTWTVFENDDVTAIEIVANPDPSGVNNSATVGKITARVTGNPWAGTESAHGDVGPITLDASNSIIKVMVYKTVISDVGIKFAIASGGAQPEIKVPNTLVNQWEELTFDLSGYIGLPESIDIDQVIFFPDFDLAGRTQDNVVYFDNIRLTDGS